MQADGRTVSGVLVRVQTCGRLLLVVEVRSESAVGDAIRTLRWNSIAVECLVYVVGVIEVE